MKKHNPKPQIQAADEIWEAHKEQTMVEYPKY